MPGIVGLITKLPRERAERELATMLGTLRHEPFYVTGTWIDESLGVYVGWSARKDSFGDGMPLSNEKGDVVLVFGAAEKLVSRSPARHRDCQPRGHELGAAEASYLVHLCEEDLAISSISQRIFPWTRGGSRTQEGDSFQRPIRHAPPLLPRSQGRLLFRGGGQGPLLSVRPELRSLDPASVGELVSLDAVLENRSLFQGISVLPAASRWRFRNGVVEERDAYFQPREWEAQTALDPDTYYKELRDVFSRNLPRYFNGRQRIAMSLTGGLDVRAVMAWYKGPEGSLPCYTFGVNVP